MFIKYMMNRKQNGWDTFKNWIRLFSCDSGTTVIICALISHSYSQSYSMLHGYSLFYLGVQKLTVGCVLLEILISSSFQNKARYFSSSFSQPEMIRLRAGENLWRGAQASISGGLIWLYNLTSALIICQNQLLFTGQTFPFRSDLLKLNLILPISSYFR